MTRWARTKSAHRHEKLPSDATPWSELKPKPKFKAINVNKRSAHDHPAVGAFEGTKANEEKALEVKTQSSLNFEICKPMLNGKTETSNEISTKSKLQKRKYENQSLLNVNESSTKEEKSEVCSEVNLSKKQKKRKKLLQVPIEDCALADVEVLFNKVENEFRETPKEMKSGCIKKRKKKFQKKSGDKKKFPRCEGGVDTTNLKNDNNLQNATEVVTPSQEETLTAKKRKRKKRGSEKVINITNNLVQNENELQNATQDGAKLSQERKISAKQRKRQRYRAKMAEERKQKGLILLPEKVERKLYLLRKSLTKSGKSPEDIKTVLRKARRKQELLHRRKQEKTCFQCQKPGHTVTDCREVRNDNQQAMGICFRCGSTEHILRRCPQPDTKGSLPYAKCFVCKEQGHLSGNCPKNSRGVYPKGGACSLCGSVNHLRKDCPTLVKSKEGPEVVAHTLTGINSVDADVVDKVQVLPPSKKKVVQF